MGFPWVFGTQVRQGLCCGRSLQLSAAQCAVSAEASGGAAGTRGGLAGPGGGFNDMVDG